MFKVMFNGTERANFVKREDADTFIDILCGVAERDAIALLDPQGNLVYGFHEDGTYFE